MYDREAKRRLVEALWEIDPAGLLADRNLVPGEYDTLADKLYRAAIVERSAESTARLLASEIETGWGLASSVADRNRALSVLRNLIEH